EFRRVLFRSYSTAAERAFTGGAAGLGQFVRFAGPLALVWAGRSFVRTRGGCSYRVGVTRSVVGAPPRCEAKANQYTEPALFAPGAGAPTGWGDAFSCRSTASVRSEGKPIHRACPVRTRGGCSYRWGDAFDCRSTASVRTESNQYTEPAHSHPGRVLLQGGGDAFSCRSTASVRTESNHYPEPAHSHPGRVLLRGGVARWIVGAPPRCEAKANQYT